jgi:hypothetical protein
VLIVAAAGPDVGTETPIEPAPSAAVSVAPAAERRSVETAAVRSGSVPSASPGASGGGGMPGARVNFGVAPSAGTLARPTTGRPAAVVPLAPASAVSPASLSTGEVEVPAAPDFACVSVIN